MVLDPSISDLWTGKKKTTSLGEVQEREGGAVLEGSGQICAGRCLKCILILWSIHPITVLNLREAVGEEIGANCDLSHLF